MEHYVMLKKDNHAGHRAPMRTWLREQFGKETDCYPMGDEGHVGTWYEVQGGFAFKNEKDALWFRLRWA